MQAPPTFDDWADGHEDKERSCADCVHATSEMMVAGLIRPVCNWYCRLCVLSDAATCPHYEEDDVCPF